MRCKDIHTVITTRKKEPSVFLNYASVVSENMLSIIPVYTFQKILLCHCRWPIMHHDPSKRIHHWLVDNQCP